MGLLVVASAMVDDLVGWLIFSVILGLIGKAGIDAVDQYHYPYPWICCIYAHHWTRYTESEFFPGLTKNSPGPAAYFHCHLLCVFLPAAFTEWIGIHAIFGAFIMGVALGDSEHFSERAKEIVHQFINNIFAPLFFVSIGLRVNFILNFDFGLTLIIIAIAFTGKI